MLSAYESESEFEAYEMATSDNVYILYHCMTTPTNILINYIGYSGYNINYRKYSPIEGYVYRKGFTNVHAAFDFMLKDRDYHNTRRYRFKAKITNIKLRILEMLGARLIINDIVNL